MFESILGKAFEMANGLKYFVRIGNEAIKEMTYFEIGLFLTNNRERIETIEINLKD